MISCSVAVVVRNFFKLNRKGKKRRTCDLWYFCRQCDVHARSTFIEILFNAFFSTLSEKKKALNYEKLYRNRMVALKVCLLHFLMALEETGHCPLTPLWQDKRCPGRRLKKKHFDLF